MALKAKASDEDGEATDSVTVEVVQEGDSEMSENLLNKESSGEVTSQIQVSRYTWIVLCIICAIRFSCNLLQLVFSYAYAYVGEGALY